jgi:ketosteroid isomerase-like protein
MRIVIRTPEEANQAFADAVNSGDVEQVLVLYEPNARLAFPRRPSVGHDAIRAELQNLLAEKPTMHAATKSVSQAGDLALLRSRWNYSGVDSTGMRIERSGDSIEVLRRQSDETWRYVIDLPLGQE